MAAGVERDGVGAGLAERLLHDGQEIAPDLSAAVSRGVAPRVGLAAHPDDVGLCADVAELAARRMVAPGELAGSRLIPALDIKSGFGVPSERYPPAGAALADCAGQQQVRALDADVDVAQRQAGDLHFAEPATNREPEHGQAAVDFGR